MRSAWRHPRTEVEDVAKRALAASRSACAWLISIRRSGRTIAAITARAAHAARYRPVMPAPRLPCPEAQPQRAGSERRYGASGATDCGCVRLCCGRAGYWPGCGPERPAPTGRTRLAAAVVPLAGSRQQFGGTWRSPSGRRAPAGLLPGERRLPASRGWLRRQGRPAGRPSAGAPTGAFISQLNYRCNSCQLKFAETGRSWVGSPIIGPRTHREGGG